MAVTRGLPAGILADFFKPEIAKFYATLIEVSGGGLLTTRRFTTGYDDVTYLTDLYTAAAFDIVLPGEQADRPPTSRLVVDNTTRIFSDIVNEADSPVDVALHVVEKDVTPILLSDYQLAAYVASYNVKQGEAVLQGPPVLDEVLPRWRFVPLWFPAIFVD